MDAQLRRTVFERANNRCEYCRLPQDAQPVVTFHVDHVRPEKHGGTDDVANLCLACPKCNLRKAADLAGFDPETDALTPLFNPRTDQWEEHFQIHGPRIHGRTTAGRTTVQVLGMNDDKRVEMRIHLKALGLWPQG